jgi:hypothetical protein
MTIEDVKSSQVSINRVKFPQPFGKSRQQSRISLWLVFQ